MNDVDKKLTLREIQLIELEISKEIKHICEENNIQYFLIGGTLLGAIRHKGFIPWDDDMDIGMTYRDYIRFINVAKEQLDSKFLLQDWNDGSSYSYPFAKVKMKGTKVIEKANRDLHINKGVWVDVFPYMPVQKQNAESSWFLFRLQMLGKMCLLKNGYDLNVLTNRVYSKLLNTILQFAPMSCRQARIKFMNMLIESNQVSSDYYIECDGMFKGNFVFPQKYFEKLIPVQFEDTEFMAPYMYHEYLTDAYGDYMTPPAAKDQAKGHSLLEATINNSREIF